MPGVDFEEFGFSVRPDLTPFLVHLTKGNASRSAMENLISILREGEIRGTQTFVRGPTPAACFMDIPFPALKFVCAKRNWNRYEPYGLIVRKQTAYERGVRPVLYLATAEIQVLGIPDEQLWRVVRFEGSQRGGWIGWLHEREWRCPERFPLPKKIIGVLVKSSREAAALSRRLNEAPQEFRCIPRSVIPLQVVCQGLPRG